MCKQLAPLPYEVSKMATVRWGDNIVVVGSADKHGSKLDTVTMYMRCKRCPFTAVFVKNNIVVLGGKGEHGELKSVESFNFERNTWQELPEMSHARYLHTAVVL